MRHQEKVNTILHQRSANRAKRGRISIKISSTRDILIAVRLPYSRWYHYPHPVKITEQFLFHWPRNCPSLDGVLSSLSRCIIRWRAPLGKGETQAKDRKQSINSPTTRSQSHSIHHSIPRDREEKGAHLSYRGPLWATDQTHKPHLLPAWYMLTHTRGNLDTQRM